MEIGIWKVAGHTPQRYQRGLILRENQLEDWIEQDPSLLIPDLSIVGRQLIVSAGRLDLLGLDPLGHWIIIEIKRGDVRRETVTQALDYAACIEQMDSTDLERHVEAYLKTRGSSLKQLLKAHGLSKTIFDERNPFIYVVGTSRDPQLDRMADYLKNRGNLSINVVNFDLFVNGQGEQILVRQLTELETGTKARPVHEAAQPKASHQPPAEDTELQRLFKLADKNGIGQEFRLVYEEATRHGLYPRLYKWSIMYAPPMNKTRVLIFTPVKRIQGGFNLYVASNAFAEFYPVREPEVIQLIGAKRSDLLDLDGLRAFFSQLDKLFALIEKYKK